LIGPGLSLEDQVLDMVLEFRNWQFLICQYQPFFRIQHKVHGFCIVFVLYCICC